MDAPPSWTEWLVDGFTRGHSVAETIAWASWTADFENWQSRQQSMPVGVTLLRRLRAAVVDHRPPLDRSRVRRGRLRWPGSPPQRTLIVRGSCARCGAPGVPVFGGSLPRWRDATFARRLARLKKWPRR